MRCQRFCLVCHKNLLTRILWISNKTFFNKKNSSKCKKLLDNVMYSFNDGYFVVKAYWFYRFKSQLFIVCLVKALSTLRRRNLKTKVLLWKRAVKCFPFTLRQRNLKTQQSPVILDLCLRKTRSGKSRDYRAVIVFKKLCFQNDIRLHENEKPAFPNSPGLRSVFEKLRFRHGLVWTVGLTVETKPRFQIPQA